MPTLQAEKAEATGRYYRLMVDHVRGVLANLKEVCPVYDPAQGFELAGFVWFQGWNDMVDRGVYPNRDQPGGYDRYSETLAHFIRDVRTELSAPEMPFVIGVLGVGGPVDQYTPEQRRYAGIHTNFRNAMTAPASLPEFQGNVNAVRTERYWDMELAGLRARDAKVRQKARQMQSEQQLSREEARALEDDLRADAFTKRELRILTTGVSNAEYHYLGSAKILARIGKAFAEAIADLRSTH